MACPGCFGHGKGVEPAQIHCAGQWGVGEGGEVGRGGGEVGRGGKWVGEGGEVGKGGR